MEATAPIQPLVPITPPSQAAQPSGQQAAPQPAPQAQPDPAPAPAPQQEAAASPQPSAQEAAPQDGQPATPPAGSTGGEAASAPAPVENPAEVAAQVVQLSGALAPVLSNSYTTVLGAARALKMQGQEIPPELQDIAERMKLIAKLTGTEVEVVKDAPIAKEVAAEPLKSAAVAQQQVFETMQSLIALGAQAAQRVPINELPEEVSSSFAQALEGIGELPMTMWAVNKLVPLPQPKQEAPAEGEQAAAPAAG